MDKVECVVELVVGVILRREKSANDIFKAEEVEDNPHEDACDEEG